MILEDVPLPPPGGFTYPVTPEWQRQVRDRLVELQMNQSDLARAAHTTSAMISYLLRHGKQSRLVPAIHKALRWPPPELPGESIDDLVEVDPQRAAMEDIWDTLTDEKRKLLINIALSWAAPSDKS